MCSLYFPLSLVCSVCGQRTLFPFSPEAPFYPHTHTPYLTFLKGLGFTVVCPQERTEIYPPRVPHSRSYFLVPLSILCIVLFPLPPSLGRLKMPRGRPCGLGTAEAHFVSLLKYLFSRVESKCIGKERYNDRRK